MCTTVGLNKLFFCLQLIAMSDIKEVIPDFQKLTKMENCIVIHLKNDTKLAITSPVSFSLFSELKWLPSSIIIFVVLFDSISIYYSKTHIWFYLLLDRVSKVRQCHWSGGHFILFIKKLFVISGPSAYKSMERWNYQRVQVISTDNVTDEQESPKEIWNGPRRWNGSTWHAK